MQRRKGCTLRPTVEYRTIDKYPGYLFGADGTIWSEWWRRGYKDYVRTGNWKRLKLSTPANGYPTVTLRMEPRVFVRTFAHVLILEAFCGPCPPGCQARHYPNREPSCIALSNLSWAPIDINSRDKWLQGTMRHGEKHHCAKLTESKVLEIRRRYASGETQVSLSREFGVRQCSISDIVRRKAWSFCGEMKMGAIQELDPFSFTPANGARFVELTADEYHSDYSAQSKSMLRRFRFRRAAYKAEFIDCSRPPPPESDQSKMGSLAHAGLLRPELLEDLYAVYPQSVLKSNGAKNPGSGKTKTDFDLFEEEAKKTGKICLKAEDMQTVRAMVGSVQNKLEKWLKIPSIRETPLYWRNKETGLLCRCLPDWLIIAGGTAYCFDLKTTASAHPDDFSRRVQDQSHWLQQMQYTEGVEMVTGLPCQFRFVVVESEYPFTCAIEEIAQFHLDDAARARIQTLRDLKQCLETGNFCEPWENNVHKIVLRPGAFDEAA